MSSLKCKQKLCGFPEDKNSNRRKVLICEFDKNCLKWSAKKQIWSANCNLWIAISNHVKIRLLLVESLIIVIFYVIFLMCYAVINYYFGKKFFSIKRKQEVNNCFKPLILSVFTTVASRLKSEQKEKINLETKIQHDLK